MHQLSNLKLMWIWKVVHQDQDQLFLLIHQLLCYHFIIVHICHNHIQLQMEFQDGEVLFKVKNNGKNGHKISLTGKTTKWLLLMPESLTNLQFN